MSISNDQQQPIEATGHLCTGLHKVRTEYHKGGQAPNTRSGICEDLPDLHRGTFSSLLPLRAVQGSLGNISEASLVLSFMGQDHP